jgi:hypothetical protein
MMEMKKFRIGFVAASRRFKLRAESREMYGVLRTYGLANKVAKQQTPNVQSFCRMTKGLAWVPDNETRDTCLLKSVLTPLHLQTTSLPLITLPEYTCSHKVRRLYHNHHTGAIPSTSFRARRRRPAKVHHPYPFHSCHLLHTLHSLISARRITTAFHCTIKPRLKQGTVGLSRSCNSTEARERDCEVSLAWIGVGVWQWTPADR